jgi:hypothetical protein
MDGMPMWDERARAQRRTAGDGGDGAQDDERVDVGVVWTLELVGSVRS